MSENTDSLIQGTETAADNGSSQPDTAAVEDENHMSVDVIVEDTTTPAALTSENIGQASSAQSTACSSDGDVIDVDAIDAEGGSVDDQKDKSADYGNPLELGLNEYYLKPASEDSPADNVIDVDAETSEAGSVTQSSETATSLTTDAKNEVALEQVDEKFGGSEMCAVGTDGENTGSSELNVTTSATAASTADDEGQSKESVVRSPRSSTDGNTASPVDTSEDVSKFAEDRSNDEAAGVSCVEVSNPETESVSAAERGDTQALDAADIGEMITEVIDDVVAQQEHSTDKDTLTVSAEAGNDMESRQEQDAEALVIPQTVPAEDVSPVDDTEQAAGKPVEAECMEELSSRDEKMMDSAESSQTGTAEAQSEGSTSVKKIEHSDDKDVTDTAQLMEMTDKPVSDSEPIKQSLESMDTVVADSENVKESAEVIKSGTVSVEDAEQKTENVENVVSEAVLSEADEVQQTGEQPQQPSEMMEEVDVPSAEETGDVVAEETADVVAEVRADVVAEETGHVAEEMAVETVRPRAETVADEGKDVTDVTANDEAATGKAVAEEDCVTQCKDVKDNSEIIQQAAEMASETANGEAVAEAEKVRDVSVVGDREGTENIVAVDENLSHLNEMKHMSDTEDGSEQLQSDVDRAATVAHSVTESDGMMDADLGGKDSVSTVSEVTQSMSASDNQQVTDVIDKVETDGELMELTHGTVTEARIERTTDEDCDKMGTTETADKMSLAVKIVGEVSAECHDGKTTQGGEMKTAAESLMSTDETAE